MKRERQSVLLIEPNRLLAEQCTAAMRRRGFDVTVTHTAQAAIYAADQHRPDIVILEILLTSHSGVEFLHEFRSYSEWRTVPVILFSRIPRTELSASDKTLEQLGVSLFLYKPVTSLAKLADRVDHLLTDAAMVA